MSPGQTDLQASLLADRCPHCSGDNLRLVFHHPSEGESLSGAFPVPDVRELQLHPPKGVRKAPSEVDDPLVCEDFEEAAALLPLSPKASAALSRRCLQHILRTKAGAKPGTLFDEITKVIGGGRLPFPLARVLERLRAIWEDQTKNPFCCTISSVEPGEAELTLDVVDILMKFYWVLPAQSKNPGNEQG